MTTWDRQALEAHLDERERELNQLRAKASTKGGLTRAERARVTEIDTEIDQLAAQIENRHAAERDRRDFDPRLGQGTPRGPAELDAGRDYALGPEQSVADWLEARGRGASRLDEEVRDFSLGRAISALVRGDWRDAPLEHRALAETTGPAGGFLIPEPLAGFVIDRLRKKMVVAQAGLTTIPMQVDELNIARLTGPGSASWKAENAAIVESQDLTFDRVQLKAKTLPLLARLSRELFDDLSPAAAQAIEVELLSVLALELDRVVLRGSGVDPEPKGIRNQTGVQIQSLGTNGAIPTGWDDFIKAISKVQQANAEPNAILLSARTEGDLARIKLTTGEYMPVPAIVAARQRLVTNQIADNITQGTSDDTSEAYVCRWADVLLGLRTDGLRLEVLKERFADNLQIGLVAYVRADVALAHAETCVVVTGIRPTA